MSNFTVLRDVSDTLKVLFKASIPELMDENAIVFDSPAEIEPATSAKLSVFLYQIAENSHLRNLPSVPVGDQMFEPPMVVDLYYMFTPYAASRDTELIILERLLQIFHDHPVFPEMLLQGQLRESGNGEIRAIPYQLSFDEINKLWERFPNKAYKLSVAYLFTPVVIASERSRHFSRVKELQVQVNSREAPAAKTIRQLPGR